MWALGRFWLFRSEESVPILYKKMKLLISSGIFYRVLNYFENQKYLERNNAAGVSKIRNRSSELEPNLLKLTGRIVTLFILFITVLLVTVLVLFFERALCFLLTGRYLIYRLINSRRAQTFSNRVIRFCLQKILTML